MLYQLPTQQKAQKMKKILSELILFTSPNKKPSLVFICSWDKNVLQKILFGRSPKQEEITLGDIP